MALQAAPAEPIEVRRAAIELAHAHLARKPSPRVLDAGCGSQTHLDYAPSVHVVGLDVSAEGLARNPRLDEAIVGDLETHPLPARSFDLIVCWDVLEHLRHPDRALGSFAGALAGDGMLLIAAPNARSLKGLVTRFTPYRFHRWVYRWARGADAPEPFRTFMRSSVAPEPLAAWARRTGLEVLLLGTYESPLQVELRQRFRLRGRAWEALTRLVAVLTRARISPEASEFVLVGRRTAAAPPGGGAAYEESPSALR